MWNREQLSELITSQLAGRKFIVVSNREPYIHRYSAGGIECVCPASGMTTAIDPLMMASGGTWIAHGSGEADAEVVDANDSVAVPPDDPRYRLRRVWLTRQEEEGYYYGLSNRALWPLCHVTSGPCSPSLLTSAGKMSVEMWMLTFDTASGCLPAVST